MHQSLALLTATLLLVLTAHVDALPTTIPFVSIPIQRLNSRADPSLPSAIVHQQHVNRAVRRLELMGRGNVKTTDEEFFANIQRRALALPRRVQKRFFQPSFLRPSHFSHGNPLLFGNFKASENSASQEDARAGVTPAQKPTFDNSLGLDIQAKDIGYLAKVQLGTPARDFFLLVDSGSADTWVGSEDCKSSVDDGDCGPHTFLGPKSSSTFINKEVPWEIYYGTGNVNGTLVIDHLAIAGLKIANLTFGVASQESAEFTGDVPFDGLLGLAKSSISRQGTVTVLEELVNRKTLEHPIASYHIPRLADGVNHGELTLGAMNPARYESKTKVEMDNINPFGFWEAKLDDVYVGGKALGLKDRTALFDTGTTLIVAPQADVDAIHSKIPGAFRDSSSAFWVIPCSPSKETTMFALKIGGRIFDVDSRDIPFQPVDELQPTGNCTSGISAGNVGGGTQWLVGDVFLKNVYMSTNAATNMISFAKLKSAK